MSALSMLAAGGVWPAVPLTGYLLFWRPQAAALRSLPPATALTLTTVAGLTVWSPLLLGTAVAGLYRAEVFGLMGWTLAAVAMVIRFRDAAAKAASESETHETNGSAITRLKNPAPCFDTLSMSGSPPPLQSTFSAHPEPFDAAQDMLVEGCVRL